MSEPRDPSDSRPAPRDVPDAGPWEQRVLQKLALSLVDERRRARRWSVFFRAAFLVLAAYGLLLAGGWAPGVASHGVGRHTALVELTGVIDAEGESSADNINAALRAAFEDHNTAGVVLRINSPGGSPVQAGIIHDEILRLRGLHPDTKLYVVVDEVCASGGYYVAAAADQILVDKASLVGSIGVLMEGFGFVGAMDKVGVERRLLTAGANKGFLDSFSPLSEEHRQHARRLLGEIHEQFIEVVRKGRGDRLKESPEIFSGLVWTGARSVELGLSDGLGTVDSVARDLIKAEDVVDFSSHRTFAERLAKKVGASAGTSAAQVFEGFLSGWRLR